MNGGKVRSEEIEQRLKRLGEREKTALIGG